MRVPRKYVEMTEEEMTYADGGIQVYKNLKSRGGSGSFSNRKSYIGAGNFVWDIKF
ncbi:hypothetical protein ACWN83_07385 [Pseudolactococcus plantarum]|nr:hypothetical protein [Lactococcus plantarum]